MLGYLAAILIGLSLGLIGGGGSILTIPILVYSFGIDPIIASTYSLFVVGVTSSAGALSHYRQGNVNVKVALFFGIPSLLLVFIMRKWLMPVLPQHLGTIGNFEITKAIVVMFVFSILMAIASVSMIRRKNEPLVNEEINRSKLLLLSIVTGLITGFVGIGGGFVIVPSLVLFAGLSMKKAVGTSLLIMTLSSLIGVAGDISRHAVVDYLFLASFCFFAVSGIVIGCYLTKYVRDNRLKPAFGWFVLVMSVIVLFNTINH